MYNTDEIIKIIEEACDLSMFYCGDKDNYLQLWAVLQEYKSRLYEGFGIMD